MSIFQVLGLIFYYFKEFLIIYFLILGIKSFKLYIKKNS